MGESGSAGCDAAEGAGEGEGGPRPQFAARSSMTDSNIARVLGA